MADRRCIVHFQAIEKYPPAINFLTILGREYGDRSGIFLLTSAPGSTHRELQIPGIHIERVSSGTAGKGKLARMLVYAVFFIKTLWRLIILRPSSILYYETLSAGAPVFYCRYINRKCRLLIHYHEYTSPQEYATGMINVRWYHRMERSFYQRAIWISHCNNDRVRMFLQDVQQDIASLVHVLPNHPPASWSAQPNTGTTLPLGIVHVGALNTEGFYLKEFAEWVGRHQDNVYFDIYSDNIQPAVFACLEKVAAPNIQFKGPVAYLDLPQVLTKYKVGVVLYSGISLNHIYSVPNKVFEYHVCGLDVWFPTALQTTRSLVTNKTRPAITAVEFDKPDQLDKLLLSDHSDLPEQKQDFKAEVTYQPLLAALMN